MSTTSLKCMCTFHKNACKLRSEKSEYRTTFLLHQINVKAGFNCQTLHTYHSARWSSNIQVKSQSANHVFQWRTFNRIYQVDVVHIKCQKCVALPFKPLHQSTSKQQTQQNSHLVVQFSFLLAALSTFRPTVMPLFCSRLPPITGTMTHAGVVSLASWHTV